MTRGFRSSSLHRIACIALFLCLAPAALEAFDLFKAYPGLAAEIDRNLEPGADRELAAARLREYFGPGDPEMFLGMELILIHDEKAKDEPNWALRLLLHLLSEKRFMPGDPMTFALALANNRLYAAVNDGIRAAIRADVVAHYDFYRELVAWQKTLEIDLDLSKAPLVPKLYWADRTAYPPENVYYGIKTLDDYREYADTIDTLRFFHDLAVKMEMYRGTSPAQIAERVRAYVHDKDERGLPRRLYNPHAVDIRPLFDRVPHDPAQKELGADGKILWRGRRDFMNGCAWINYQRRLIESTGLWMGLCEASSVVELALFKALGFGAGLAVRSPQKDAKIPGHVFAVYYDPFRQRWNNLEMIRKYDHPMTVRLWIDKPVWQARLSGLQNRVSETAPAARFFKLLGLGIQRKHFDEWFFKFDRDLTDSIFSRQALPDELVDTDLDSIYDFEEALLGLDPARPDTAADGVSDLWKLYRGFDPRAPLPAGAVSSPPLDGLDGGVPAGAAFTAVTVPPFTGKPKTDDHREIDTMSAAVFGDSLYVRVTFHNDIRLTKTRTHYLSVAASGPAGKAASFDLFVEGGNAYPSDKAKKTAADGYRDLRGAAYRTVELSIPLRYLNGATSVAVRYWKALVKGEVVAAVPAVVK